MNYKWLFQTQQRLARRAGIIGDNYATQFLKDVDAAIEKAFEATEARRKADNAKRA